MSSSSRSVSGISQSPVDDGGALKQQPADRRLIPEFLDLRPPIASLDLPHVQNRRDSARLKRASWAFATRRIPVDVATSIIHSSDKPLAGDLVLARVDALGHHRGLQLPSGRRKIMFVGDEIVVAYGNRYASSQFKSFVPETMGPCHLVAGGGIASRVVSWHKKMSRGATSISPIGLVADGYGKRINLRDFCLPSIDPKPGYDPTIIAVVGTSMDSGKTDTAAYLAKGLIQAGLRVGYAKITGTGAGGDTWLLKDAGADPVLDFTDAGLPSTYLSSPDEILDVLRTLIAHTTHAGVDAIILEIADGVFQEETSALLSSPEFAQLTGGIVLAALDSMGASAGVNWLKNYPTPVLALSGIVSGAPLQVEEAISATNLDVLDRESLATPNYAMKLLGQAQRHQLASAHK